MIGAILYEARPSFEKRWCRHQSSFYLPVARWLKANAGEGTLVALSDVGYISYYSGIKAIDTLGLVNRHLARLPGAAAFRSDVEYVLEKEPALLISMIRHYEGGAILGHTAFDRDVLKSKQFQEKYELAQEIDGYDADEISLGDLKRRRYHVTFRIFRRRG